MEEAAFEPGLKEQRGFASVDRAESYITYYGSLGVSH